MWISRVSDHLYYVVSENLLGACKTDSTFKSEQTAWIQYSAYDGQESIYFCLLRTHADQM